MFFSKSVILGALLSAIAPVLSQAEQLVIAIDESGSMQDNQQRVKNNVDLLFNRLNSPTGLTDPLIGIVGYGAGRKFSHNAYTVTPLTNDATTFMNGLNTLVANGAYEWGYKLAVELATNKIRGPSLGLDLDPAKGFCLLLISDEPFNQDKNFSRANVEAAFAATGGVFFGVGRITQQDQTLAANTGGQVFSIVDFEADPTGVIDAMIAKCKVALPPPPPTPAPTQTPTANPTKAPTLSPSESPSAGPTASPSASPSALPSLSPTDPKILTSLLKTTSSLVDETFDVVDETVDVVDAALDVVDVVVDGTKTILDLTTGSITYFTQTLVDKLVLTISTLLDGVDCLVHHSIETVDDILTKVIITVNVVLDDVIVELKETLVYVDGILDKTLVEVECTGKSVNFLIHSVFELVDGVVHKVSETLEGTVVDVKGLLVPVLDQVHDVLTTTVTLIEGNVADLEDTMMDKLSMISDIANLAKTITCGGTKKVVEVVGGTVEWITLDLVDKVVFTADALLDTVKCLLTHTVHKVNGLLSEIIVLVKTTLSDVVITLEQKFLYVDGVLDKVIFEVVCATHDGEILLHSLFEDVNDIVTAVSEVIDGTTNDVKALLGNRLVEVDGLLQLLLSTVNDNVDELTNALISDDEMDNIHFLCGNFVEVLGLGKLLDGTLLGGLDADLDLCPCFAAHDLISIEACVEIEHLNNLDCLGVTACPDNLSLEAAVTNSDNLVARVNVDLNGLFQCALSGDLLGRRQRKNRRNLRQRGLLLGNLVNEVVETVDDVVETVVGTVDTVVDTVDTLISDLTFDEYNSCLSLLLQRCHEVPQCK